MENALLKSIEGGYSPISMGRYECECGIEEHDLLNSKFWQALGKQQGWDITTYKKLVRTTSTSFRTKTITIKRKSGVKSNWKAHWHRFIDHLIEGKEPDEFFNQLLK